MTDETAKAEGPTPHQVGRADMKAADQAAAEAHAARLDELGASHSELLPKLGELQAAVSGSLAKATEDPQHAAYTESFLRDLHLVVEEKLAWIRRHI
jgi:hypothetical protein